MSSAVTQGPWAPNANNTRSFDRFEPFSPLKWGTDRAPRVDWMVEGCFIRGAVAILSGDGGLGKSLLCQQLMTAANMGFSWLGMRTVRARSLGVFCEDDVDELHRRQEAINDHYHCSMKDLDGVRYESRPGRDCTMMTFPRWGSDGKLTPMFTQVANAAVTHKAEFVFLDTVADVFSGNEIDRNQPRTFIRALRQLAIKLQGCVVLTQHPSVEGMKEGSGRSGSTGWNNSARSRLWLTKVPKDETGNLRSLRTMKMNQGKSGGKIKLRWSQGVFELADEAELPYYVKDELPDEEIPF